MNVQLLKAKMVEKGITQASLATKRGCTLNTFNRMLNGHIKMTIDDALFLCDELDIIEDSEKCKIFLPQKSQKRDRN